jgi:hypothetical protein
MTNGGHPKVESDKKPVVKKQASWRSRLLLARVKPKVTNNSRPDWAAGR